MIKVDKRWAIPGIAAAVAILAFIVWPGSRTVGPERPLERYVAKPDDSYSWSIVGTRNVGTTEILELRLHSQTWRGNLWKHRLFVLKPARLSTGTQALLALSGGRWRLEYEDASDTLPDPEDAALFLLIAETLETIVIVLDQVPFQPLFDLTEDELIAYTFDQYLTDLDPDWPLLLPMVKSAVRAMDAATAAVNELWDIDLSGFTITGGSKRGWTAWLMAAVDNRVAAIAPIVFDALNMEAHFPHQTEVWGEPSEKIRPYTERNLHIALSTEAGRDLREIVDPYAYRDALELPKLLINATNDEYFPVDSANLYWDRLAGANYALYLPNQGHSASDLTRLIPSLGALHRAAAGGATMPSLSWQYVIEPDSAGLCITSVPAPLDVSVWLAESADRDFRDERWSPARVSRTGETWLFEHAREPGIWVAMYAEATYGTDTGRYTLTTTPAVLGPAAADGGIASAAGNGRPCDPVSQD